MEDLISRQCVLYLLGKMQTYKLAEGDDMLLIDKAEAQTEVMMLPSEQPEVTEEAVKEYCRKRCLCIVDSALLKKYASAQPERKKGKWIYGHEYKIIGNPYGHYRCDQCQTIVGYETHFCPDCGAEMER